MNHKVENLPRLYEDAEKLYTDVVKGKADGIINNLSSAINTLKNSWKGKDAGVQINNVVEVYNGMAAIRNALAILARDSSHVAVDYMEIQRMNSASTTVEGPVTIDEEKPMMAPYSDDRDTIDITSEAVNGKSQLDAVNDQYDNFATSVKTYHDAIMNNWQAGPRRNDAQAAFEEFEGNAERYKKILVEVSQSIATALKNYSL